MGQQKIKTHYDHLVVGGGIVGAGILRDLALHGEDVLLVERGDFSSQTSQGSSKMLHGGIRYLENFDFLLVHEALREKKIWLKLAGHIAHEQRFYLPVYKHSKWPLFFLKIGLFLYDLLSFFKNPPYKTFNKNKVKEVLPDINPKDLKGAGLYSDGVIDDSKLVLDLIFDSLKKGANALNYHEVIEVIHKGNVKEIKLKDTINNNELIITCNNLIFAVGPFTDQVLHKLNIPWEDVILPSKGTHLWLKKEALYLKEAIVLQTNDNRIIFVIPQRNAILVGTTEVPLDPQTEMFNIQPSESEVVYLLNTVNEYFPKAHVNEQHILAKTAAVRPLVKSSWSKSSGKTSRKHKVYNPEHGIYVIAGGKYTTFRVMAQDLCKLVFKNINKKYSKNLSLTPFEKKSIIYDIHKQNLSKEILDIILEQELVRTKDDLIKRRLSLYSLDQAQNSNELKDLIDQLPSI